MDETKKEIYFEDFNEETIENLENLSTWLNFAAFSSIANAILGTINYLFHMERIGLLFSVTMVFVIAYNLFTANRAINEFTISREEKEFSIFSSSLFNFFALLGILLIASMIYIIYTVYQ